MKLYVCSNRDNCYGTKYDKRCEFYYPKKITHFCFGKKRTKLRIKQQFKRTKNLDIIQFFSFCEYIGDSNRFYLMKIRNK